MSIQLTVEVQDANLILAGLAELPLKQGLDTWFKVKSQAEQQLAAQQQNEAPGPITDVPAAE